MSTKEKWKLAWRDIRSISDQERLYRWHTRGTRQTTEYCAIWAWHTRTCLFSYPWRPGRDLRHINTIGPIGWLP